MKAMLLCAGLGERMLPLTGSIPKAALPVLGRSLAEQILRRLKRHGVGRAVLNLHHLPDVLRSLLRDRGLPRIDYSFEERILGTAGGIRRAERFLRGSGPFLVLNSDFLSDIDIEAALEAHRRSGCAATLVLAEAREGYSVVETDAQGRVLSIAGQPSVDRERVTGRHLFTGFHILEEEVLDRIPATEASGIVRDVYVGLASEGRLGSHVHSGFWWEFGTLRTYLEGSLRLLDLPDDRRYEIAETDPVRRIGEAVVAVGTGADFHNAVELNGAVAIGFASMIGEGSILEDSVVLQEAWVGPGCRLRRALLAPGVEVPAGYEIEDALLCPDTEPAQPLPPDTERRDGLLVRKL